METITICTGGEAKGEPGPAVIGVVISNAKGDCLKEVSEKIGNATSYFTEYFAVMRGLQLAQELFEEKTNSLHFDMRLDSEYVKKQLNGESQIKDPGLVPYFIEIHNLRVASFPNLSLTLIEREENKKVLQLMVQTLS